MGIKTALLTILALLGLALAVRAEEPTPAATVYVNNLTGSDAFTGLAPAPAGDGKTGPCATIMGGLKQAGVGAHVSIANTGTDYRETVAVANLGKGRPAMPLVIDGHGATVSGLVVVPAERWTKLRDDLYWFENKLPDGKPGSMPNSNWLMHNKHQGWFTEPQAPEIFFLDAQAAPHTRDLESIPAGGFFYDTQASPRRLYFRLPTGKPLADLKIEIPLHSGVGVDDDYVVVRNLVSKYSQDDGFHGMWGLGIVFENINGSYNCDQGYSMHGDSVTFVDGALFERNGGCGICDVMSCVSNFRNVVVRDNMITGALMMGHAHSFVNCRFYGNQSPQVSGSGDTALSLWGCLVVGNGADANGGIGVQMGVGRFERCTIVNCNVGLTVYRAAQVNNSIITNCAGDLIQARAEALPAFSLHKTLLGLGTMTFGPTKLNAETWPEYAKTFKGATDAMVNTPALEGPLYLLPKDSPYYAAADYNRTLGGRLEEYPGWQPVP